MLECINLGYLIIKEGDTFNIFPEFGLFAVRL